jgi:hypothetical protein
MCPSGSPAVKRTSRPARLEQFDRVSGGVVEQDLRAARSGHDVVAETDSRRTETFDLRRKLLDDQVDTVPAPRSAPAAIGGEVDLRVLKLTFE